MSSPDHDPDFVQRLRDAETTLLIAENEHAKAKALLGACRDHLRDATKAFRQAAREFNEAPLPLFPKSD